MYGTRFICSLLHIVLLVSTAICNRSRSQAERKTCCEVNHSPCHFPFTHHSPSVSRYLIQKMVTFFIPNRLENVRFIFLNSHKYSEWNSERRPEIFQFTYIIKLLTCRKLKTIILLNKNNILTMGKPIRTSKRVTDISEQSRRPV